jgi:hypothetical protein
MILFYILCHALRSDDAALTAIASNNVIAINKVASWLVVLG